MLASTHNYAHALLRRIAQTWLSVSLRALVTLLLGSVLLLSTPARAEQLQTLGNLEIHYSVFPSTMLTPEIASRNGLTRSNYRTILTVTALDASVAGKPAVDINLSGQAQNLIGNTRQLSFKAVQEGSARYYLAEVPIVNEETYRFTLDIQSKTASGTVRFQQTFYTD
ncbi:MAG: DUF4426 domain-containing protein [Plesiomonas shigelloides]